MAANEQEELTGQDVADILATTIQLLRDSGLQVGVKTVPQKEDRPAGVLIYCSDIGLDDAGSLIYLEREMQ
jgi:hypothetical protein